jgi:xanthine/uracil permease
MKKVLNWLCGLLKDEKGTPSSKRFVGIIAGLTLCITLFANQFTDEHTAPSPVLVNAVAALAFGALGLASVDKIWANKRVNEEVNE